jgi:hypothetical protein
MAGLSLGNRFSTGSKLSVGQGFSQGSGLYFNRLSVPPALNLVFAGATTLDSRVTFSRPSLGMLFDSTGKYTYCPNNLLTYNTDPNSWTKSGVASVVGQVVTFTGAGAFQQIANSGWGGTAIVGQKFVFGVTLSGSGTITLDGNGCTGTNTVTLSSTPTYYVVNLTAAATSSIAARIISYVGDTATSFTMHNAYFSAVTYETTTRPSDFVNTTASAYYGPRFDYNPVTLQSLGLLIEPTRTNIALWNRDLTDGAWVKTGCSAAKDQTGIDGVSSSASSLTATAPNATCLQTVILPSSLRITSAYVKAINVTGNIQITTDNITWTTVTIGSTWSRVTIPNQTVTDPVFGFQVVNSGDSIAVDFVVNEGGLGTNPSPSTAMWTKSSPVTRSQDDMSVTPINAFYDQTKGTFLISFDILNTGTDTTVFCVDDGTTTQNNEFDVRSLSATSIAYRTRTAGANSFAATHSGFTFGQIIKSAFAVIADDMAAVTNTVPVTQSTPPNAMPATTMTQIIFGRRGTTGVLFIGHIRSFTYYNTRLTNAQIQALTA